MTSNLVNALEVIPVSTITCCCQKISLQNFQTAHRQRLGPREARDRDETPLRLRATEKGRVLERQARRAQEKINEAARRKGAAGKEEVRVEFPITAESGLPPMGRSVNMNNELVCPAGGHI